MKTDIKPNVNFFSEMKSSHKILIIAGCVILLYSAGKAMKSIAKKRAMKKSFTNENYDIAKRLYIALYPEGKSDAKFSIWNPASIINVAKDVFKSNADVDAVMRIAGNDITPENFKKVAKGYSKMYNSILLEDLQKRLDEDYKTFDNKVRKQSAMNEDPEMGERVIKTLAKKMYIDMDAWPRFSVDDNLYNQLNQMSDRDFIKVYNEYKTVLSENNESGTMRTWINDDHRTMDAYDDIEQRFNYLGLE